MTIAPGEIILAVDILAIEYLARAGQLIHNVGFIGVGAGQDVTLPAATGAGSFALLIIQGLIENPSNYAVSGKTLIIPPGLVWDGAECLFLFAASPTTL